MPLCFLYGVYARGSTISHTGGICVTCRIGICIKLFVSTDSTSSHEFPSQFGLAFIIREKHPQTITNTDPRARFCWNEPASDPSKRGGNAGYGRPIASDHPDRQQHERSTAVIAASD